MYTVFELPSFSINIFPFLPSVGGKKGLYDANINSLVTKTSGT